MIQIRDLHKVYKIGDKQIAALKGINLRVAKGEIFGVVGFSGAGKSSLIRCVNLLEKPSSGQILVGGVDITGLKGQELRAARKRIGMIFQHFNLLSNKTVFHNVAVPLYLSGVGKKEAAKRVMDLLSLVNLEDKANSYPGQLSGGQKQRVAIARALATNPEVLLSDEATSALDPQTTASILQLLKEINRTLGITILLITHEMNVVREICDRVALMEDGQIIEEGYVVDLFTMPKTETAKAFTKAVMGDGLPDGLLHANHAGQLVKITFLGPHASDPMLSTLSKRFPVYANVLHGHISKIKDVPFGIMVVEFTGEPEAIVAAIEFLKEHGMKTEVLQHG